MNWERFMSDVPELASPAEGRFRNDGLCLVGTLRKDGWPRISPCELDFAAGELLLGMMWRSRKALDLLRDPRIVVHSVTSDREGTEGDVKLYGRAIDTSAPEVREAYRDAIRARIGWAPDEPEYHLFALDIESAGYIVFGGDGHALTWDPSSGLRRLPLPETT
jgi:Pyridoxamine 5'-phosphate oxidase